MKIALINSVSSYGSTGRICDAIASMAIARGYEAKVFYGLGKSNNNNAIKISNGVDYIVHNVLSRLFDAEGLFSSIGTLIMIRELKEYQPDIIHIHNLHGHYINFKLLFKFIGARTNSRVIMTLHDCWSFTGHCAHFDIVRCEKWHDGCYKCPHREVYPKSYLSRSERNYNLKKELIANLGARLYLVPVSNWMSSFLSKSMYTDIKYSVIHNGIDLTVFKYSENSDVLTRYKIKGKYILGIANPWSSYKGLDDMVKLRSFLDESISMVLVGLSQEQIDIMTKGVVGLRPTNNLEELVALYSSALVLVNTTYCDNYPTVNLESIACGTPVITYKTGGSPESITSQTGAVVRQGDVQGLVDAIDRMDAHNRDELREHCISYAKSFFNQDLCFDSYINLYSSL